MGGAIAIAQIVAHKYSSIINKLIILNSTYRFNERMLASAKNLLNLRKLNLPLETIIEISLPWFFSSKFLSDHDNIDFFKAFLKNNFYPQSIFDQERQLKALEKFDARSWIHEIKNPTMVMAAEEDIICLPLESQNISEKVRTSKIQFLSGGHSTPIEYPFQINQKVFDFLTSN